MDAICRASRNDGAPCKARALASGYCLSHDPTRRAEMAEARRKGGQAKANQRRALKELEERALSPEQFAGLIGQAALAVYEGTKSPAVASAVANLAKAAVTIEDATKTQERLAALEAMAGQERR